MGRINDILGINGGNAQAGMDSIKNLPGYNIRADYFLISRILSSV